MSDDASLPISPEGIGKLAESGAKAFTETVPGRKIVSVARATVKAQGILQRGIHDLVRTARANGWSEEYLTWNVQQLCYDMGKRENLEAVVNHAVASLRPGTNLDEESVDKVGGEWMNYLIDHAECCTDKDVRQIWGAILAGEVNVPGSYSKHALATLAGMSREDVISFRDLCMCIVELNIQFAEGDNHDSFYRPMLVMEKDEGRPTYNGGSLSAEDIITAESYGLLNMAANTPQPVSERYGVSLRFGNTVVTICGTGSGRRNVILAPALTRAGRELSRLCRDRDEAGIRAALAAKEARDELRVLGYAPAGGGNAS